MRCPSVALICSSSSNNSCSSRCTFSLACCRSSATVLAPHFHASWAYCCRIAAIGSCDESGISSWLAYPAYLCGFERVTDGARTRDLRSHNPMLYQLSYGHHAQGDSTSARARGKRDMDIALFQSPQPRNSVFLSWRLASSTMRKSLDGLGVLMITTLPWVS